MCVRAVRVHACAATRTTAAAHGCICGSAIGITSHKNFARSDDVTSTVGSLPKAAVRNRSIAAFHAGLWFISSKSPSISSLKTWSMTAASSAEPMSFESSLSCCLNCSIVKDVSANFWRIWPMLERMLETRLSTCFEWISLIFSFVFSIFVSVSWRVICRS